MTRDAKATFPFYGVLGLLLTLGTLAATITNALRPREIELLYRVATWTTPLAWWGYLLFVDAWIYRLQGHSLLKNRRGTFWLMLPLSVLFWVWFEYYNFHLRNWHYEGLSPIYVERVLGMIVAFATVLPGIFLTAEWIEAVGLFRNLRMTPIKVTPGLSYAVFFVGIFSVIFPLLMPREVAKYLFALVWLGYAFLLDPINRANGMPSLLADLERGSLTRMASLFTAGIICGFWWESWNFLAPTKWVYDAPFTPGLQIFEMPMAGFLGFGPFAWELYAMYHFARVLDRSSRGRPSAPVRMDGDPL